MAGGAGDGVGEGAAGAQVLSILRLLVALMAHLAEGAVAPVCLFLETHAELASAILKDAPGAPASAARLERLELLLSLLHRVCAAESAVRQFADVGTSLVFRLARLAPAVLARFALGAGDARSEHAWQRQLPASASAAMRREAEERVRWICTHCVQYVATLLALCADGGSGAAVPFDVFGRPGELRVLVAFVKLCVDETQRAGAALHPPGLAGAETGAAGEASARLAAIRVRLSAQRTTELMQLACDAALELLRFQLRAAHWAQADGANAPTLAAELSGLDGVLDMARDVVGDALVLDQVRKGLNALREMTAAAGGARPSWRS